MAAFFLILLAYIIGSTPFGLIVAMAAGRIDIRRHGSGNIGATNVGRVLGSRYGAVVLVLDLLKGLLTTWLLPKAMLPEGSGHGWVVATGVATIVGHMFPFWLGFRGGKGVATALGVIAILGSSATLASAGVFLLSFALWRIVSLSSILATLCFAAVQIPLLLPNPFSTNNLPLTVFSLAVPGLIVLRHRGNIARLFRGEEPRYQFRKLEPTPESVKSAGH